MYCYILNKRLTAWDERNVVINDAQNGFVNHDNSEVVHFRPQSVQQTQHIFRVGANAIETETKHSYLGLLLTEHNTIIVLLSMLRNRQTGH